ncbi:MAG TPA: ribbon-helix-helix protein, CopG family [Candidatus Korarchaeota archaeon]|nr:ribbon-helix-helix protein, CopG family [Candidatus Korarchaeota archaeon]
MLVLKKIDFLLFPLLSMISAKIPRDLKRKLRRRAIWENKSMTELIIQALTSFLNGDGSYGNSPYLDLSYYDKRIEEFASQLDNLRALLASHGIIQDRIQNIQKEPIPSDGSYTNKPENKEEACVKLPELPEGLGEDMRELLDNSWASILAKKGRVKDG